MSIPTFHRASKRTRAITGFVMSLVMVFQALGPGVFSLNNVSAAGPSNTTVVVSPSNMNGWATIPGEGSTDGTSSFVTGPATPPIGSGSLQLQTVASTDGVALGTFQFAGTDLSAITSLVYSTYVTSAGPQAPALQFEVASTTGSDATYQGRLVYEPYFTHTITPNTWQTWNPMDNAGSGNWWFSNGALSASCSQSNPCTWSEVLTDFPDMHIRNNGSLTGLTLFKAGTSWPDFQGNVDNFQFGTASGITTFDFDPTASTSTPSTATIIATKVVCDDPSDLPPWGQGTHMSSTTATDFVAASNGACHLQPNWQFQWTDNNSAVWHAFDTSTDVNGQATAAIDISSLPTTSDDALWVREVEQPGYIPFAFPGHDINDFATPSAEMYCYNDGWYHDNYDSIDGPQSGGTYYCVAFNAPSTPIAPPCTATTTDMISSDTNTQVTNINPTDPNDPATLPYNAVLVTPTAVTSTYWTATTTDTNAKWIWSEDPVSGWTTDKTVTFEKTFSVTGTTTPGSITIGADNTYDIQLNGNEVGSDLSGSLNTFGTAATYAIPASDFVLGSNTLTITVKNLGQGGNDAESKLDNPAGLFYTLSWTASDCGDTNGGGGGNPQTPGTPLQVHIAKYLDGNPATAQSADSYAFPMSSTWNYLDTNSVIQSGTGTFTLSPAAFGPSGDTTVGPYQADTSVMTSGATYSTQEITSNVDGTSKVLPPGADCVAGDYELDGYGVSNVSFADAWAHVQAPAGPSEFPSFNSGLNQDAWIVVANHTCAVPETGPSTVNVHIFKYIDGVAASTTSTTAAFPMVTTFNSTNIGTATDAPFTLSPKGWGSTDTAYEASFVGSDPGADYSAHEVTSTDGGVVGPNCSTGQPYSLIGYTTGDTLAQAEAGTATTTIPSFTDLQNDKYVIVWNIQCPTLTIVKTVNNAPENGTHIASDFTLDVSATNPSAPSVIGNASGTTITLDPGSYTVKEEGESGGTGLFGYTVSYGDNCSGTISAGQNITCTVTNTDNPPPGTNFTLTVTETGSGTGTVLGDQTTDNINCSDIPSSDAQSCVETYPSGTVVNLSADPNEDSNFTDTWSGACTGNGACQVTMNTDQAVNANFTLNGSGGGCTTNCGGGSSTGCGTACNTNSGLGGGGGGGGGGNGGTPQVLGASTSNPNLPQVLGATTDLPNLPDTGNGDRSDTLATILVLLSALFLVNFIAIQRSRKDWI